MQNASVEAQNMAASANGMVVNLEQIPKVSKAGQVALKGLAIFIFFKLSKKIITRLLIFYSYLK